LGVNAKYKLKIAKKITKSRAITLQILNNTTIKPPGAKLHLLTNISVKLHDLRSNISWSSDARHKLKILQKRAINYLVKGDNSVNIE
jgi:hypothetical protein